MSALIAFTRVASGDYESARGTFRCWRIPDVSPPAWNIERVADCRLIVDGAATKTDALELFDDWVAEQVGVEMAP